ncbi:MAG: tRNA glutamyl-Q(34) synthetase GluQRS [Minwuia sp.]|nr:tRNA glutamyl-Q(34) synthetase GluQRS [Minwuia sp.]
MTFITRFAPSPTGYLHSGHALSAITAHDAARAAGGTFLLRIEDIDHTRCRPAFVDAISEDLAALGLTWDGPVWRQSMRGAFYATALDDIRNKGLAYPCFCNRRQVAAHSPGQGADGLIYGGTCRDLSRDEVAARVAAGQVPAWRLRLDTALQLAGAIVWQDRRAGWQDWAGDGVGDVVIARRDIATSYHLAVVVDDAAQGVTQIIRGMDLFHQTAVHVLLQRILDLPTPHYLHHQLLSDADGRKLSKSAGARSLRDIFAEGTDGRLVAERLRKVIAGAT